MNQAATLSKYQRDIILSASPARLTVMLYDRLLLDLERAETSQTEQRWPDATEQILHAQAIITELQSTLDVDLWDGGKDLFAIYSYVTSALINANVNRDVASVREAIGMLEPLREAWHTAVDQTQTVAHAG